MDGSAHGASVHELAVPGHGLTGHVPVHWLAVDEQGVLAWLLSVAVV